MSILHSHNTYTLKLGPHACFLGTLGHRSTRSAETLARTPPSVVYAPRHASEGGSPMELYVHLCLFMSYKHAKESLDPILMKIHWVDPRRGVSGLLGAEIC